ncbi:ATP-binding cassette domain-containing protein [uncultured Nonlabens sp.]|uniref:ATP-binding cassette domain-containing protein n=1 Tax=uncultured Nonlabens sp. TaxID=859306 RepID=UPI00262E8500|nr:ATP-binding cassette domain-containing protein [uncultured Nonlabens sp.]
MPKLRVQINNSKKVFWQNNAMAMLSHIDLVLEKGQVVGLLGRNGCGKSTLMNIIFGKLKVNAVAHYDRKAIQLHDHLKHQLVAYLPQEPFMISSGTVVDAVQMWYPDPEDQDKILYEPMIHKIHHVKVNSLSLGERRFLEFMLVIHTYRPFILLDEPFSMLAPLQIERVKEIIKTVKPRRGILMSDHYYDNVLEMSDICYILKESTLVAVENEEHLRNNLYI